MSSPFEDLYTAYGDALSTLDGLDVLDDFPDGDFLALPAAVLSVVESSPAGDPASSDGDLVDTWQVHLVCAPEGSQASLEAAKLARSVWSVLRTMNRFGTAMKAPTLVRLARAEDFALENYLVWVVEWTAPSSDTGVIWVAPAV